MKLSALTKELLHVSSAAAAKVKNYYANTPASTARPGSEPVNVPQQPVQKQPAEHLFDLGAPVESVPLPWDSPQDRPVSTPPTLEDLVSRPHISAADIIAATSFHKSGFKRTKELVGAMFDRLESLDDIVTLCVELPNLVDPGQVEWAISLADSENDMAALVVLSECFTEKQEYCLSLIESKRFTHQQVLLGLQTLGKNDRKVYTDKVWQTLSEVCFNQMVETQLRLRHTPPDENPDLFLDQLTEEEPELPL